MSNTIFNNITLTKKIKINNKIIMYCGNTLPSGYVWCDGNNGTPNLKNRFIYGISSGNTGDFGNSEINSIPNHNHSITATKDADTISTNYTDINYKKIAHDKVDGINIGSGQRGGGTTITHKQHSHTVNNGHADNSQTVGDTLTTIINTSNNNTSQEHNNIQNTGFNSNVFEQKYIYIGFIMKI